MHNTRIAYDSRYPHVLALTLSRRTFAIVVARRCDSTVEIVSATEHAIPVDVDSRLYVAARTYERAAAFDARTVYVEPHDSAAVIVQHPLRAVVSRAVVSPDATPLAAAMTVALHEATTTKIRRVRTLSWFGAEERQGEWSVWGPRN
jgi:hypothetical protein